MLKMQHLIREKSLLTTKDSTQVITALLVAVVIYLIAVVMPKFVIDNFVPKILTTQGLELLLSLLAIAIVGKGMFSKYGFCLPRVVEPGESGTRWMRSAAFAPLLGIVASPLILVLGGKGNPMVKQLSLLQIILFIWVFSSIIEEVFTRGFLQGHLSSLSGKYCRFLSFRIEFPVLISSLFFAFMHLALIFTGVDATTMIVTIFFTFSIGLMAGHLRAKTGSLIPAIVVHMLANIGGMIGGIIYAIINFLLTGKLPGA